MKELIEYLARAVVDRPEAVQLKVSAADGATLYELSVAREDVGKVIGRDGRTINAIRTVVTHAAQKKGEKVRLELLEERSPPTPAGPPGT